LYANVYNNIVTNISVINTEKPAPLYEKLGINIKFKIMSTKKPITTANENNYPFLIITNNVLPAHLYQLLMAI